MADFSYYLNRQGIRGIRGEKGDQGFSPIITVEQDDASGYFLRIITQDDNFVTSNLRFPIVDTGGNFLKWNKETGEVTAGFIDNATEDVVGGVVIASLEDVMAGEETGSVITPSTLSQYVEAALGQLTADVTQAGNNTFTGTNTFNNNVTFNNPVECTNSVDLRGVTVAHEGITAKKIGSADGYMVFNNINDTPTELAFGDTTANTTIRSAGDIKAVINGSTETTIATDADLQVVRDEVNSTNDKVEALDTAVNELKANATTQGNVFNGANQLVQLDSGGKLPAIDGSQLTNLPTGGGGTGDVTAAGNNTFTGTNEFNGEVTFNQSLKVTSIEDSDGVDVFAPLGSSNALGSKTKNTVLRGNTLTYSSGSQLHSILHEGNVNINTSVDTGLYWSDKKIHCGGYISNPHSTLLGALRFSGGLYRETNQDGVESVALVFDKLDGLQTYIQYTSTTPTEFANDANGLVAVNNAFASDDQYLFTTGNIDPISNGSSKTVTYKFNNMGSDENTFYGKVVTGIDSFVDPLPEGVTISYAAGNSPNDMTPISFEQLEQNKIQGLYFSITITNNRGSTLWSSDYIGNDADGNIKPIELITSDATDSGHIFLQPKVDGQTIKIVDGVLTATGGDGDYQEEIDAINADVADLQTQVGNISTVLDQINGEVI